MITEEDHALNVGKLKEVKLAILESAPDCRAALIKEQVALETEIISYIVNLKTK
jgi:hypothetical protein